MVRAILSGKKRKTRRIVKLPEGINPYRAEPSYDHFETLDSWEFSYGKTYGSILFDLFYTAKAPYAIGDLLYVRETWAGIKLGPKGKETTTYWYRADEDDERLNPDDKWRPSIHMPKEAARIWLKVTNVRCERLQDIDEDDAYYEGFRGCPYELALYFKDGSAEPCHVGGEGCPCDYWYCNHSAQEAFGRDIWDKTIKPDDLPHYGWDANPWVWVIEFERVER